MHSHRSMHARPHEARRQLAFPGITDSSPEFYVPLPYTLLSDLRNAPAAIGAYTLIGRLFRLLRGAPVFLSTNDLMAYDPRLKLGSARRAIQILRTNGYLAVAATHGTKRGYIPTWGHVNGEPRCWDTSAPILNRPPHIRAYRLDQRFLDTCMGVIETHRQHAAKIDRYIAMPFLGLREIGEYALNATGYHTPSPRLEQLGLLENSIVHRLPSDQRLLANASLQENLTPLGWRHRFFSKAIQALSDPAAADEDERPLFFVSPEMIAGRIGAVIDDVIAGVIAGEGEVQSDRSAPESHEGPVENQSSGSHGIMNRDEEDEDEDHPATRASALPQQQRGGTHLLTSRAKRTGRAVPQPEQGDAAPLPDTDAVKLLQSLGVMPTKIRQYMDEPLETVQIAVDYARTYPGGRDLAALAVQALRDMRQGWTPPARQGRYTNQIAPRNNSPDVWDIPEHDYRELAEAIMPAWALAKPFPGDAACLANIIVRLEGDDRKALDIFAEENWTRSGRGAVVYA